MQLVDQVEPRMVTRSPVQPLCKSHESLMPDEVVLEVVTQYGDLLCYAQPKHQRPQLFLDISEDLL